MSTIKDIFKKILLFQEPKQAEEEFILKEYKEKEENQSSNNTDKIKKASIKKAGTLDGIKSNSTQDSSKKVSKKIDDNLNFLKNKYSIPLNTDIMLRDFDITLGENLYKAFIIFIDGLTDRNVINEHVLKPLLLLTSLEKAEKVDNVITYVERNILPQNQLKKCSDFEEIIADISFGSCVLFIDGADEALVLDVKFWEHRTVGRPNVEITIRGPQEGFGEILRTNTALIRKMLINENLITEGITLGARSKNPSAIMYIKDIANPDLVSEVKRRLSSLKLDYAADSGIIEQLIEDNSFLPFPQTIATERPDRVAALLTEGRVAILVDGNPFVLVVPTTFFELVQSPEDSYVRFPYANLMRIIRYLAIFAALLLPGAYVAVTTYHQEMIPTDLLLAISAAREKVPFPTVIEILIMEISFELIREAGIRMPGTIGPTLGIIGALILGQAAVAANVVSPILIIIVAVTGIGSLAIPNFALSFSFRILRFAFIGLGAIAGLLGISLGIFVQGLSLAAQKSFGVPLLAPYAPGVSSGTGDTIIKSPTWMQEMRPDFLSPLDLRKQPKISRGWTVKNKEDKKK